MPIIKRKITVLYPDKCDDCKRRVERGEEAYMDMWLKLTCKECNDIRTKS